MTHAFYKKRWVKITAAVILVILLIPAVLRGGIELAAIFWKPWAPDYDMVDITALLEKESLTDEDYDLLFRQTGLTKLGIDGFIESGKKGEILRIQNAFFAEPDYYCDIFHFCVGMFKKNSENGSSIYPYAVLENGDVIFSPATYISFLEISHAAIVVDGKRGHIAEAYGYGTDLSTCSASAFFVYPAFVILRPKAGSEVGETASKYVRDNMIGTPYDLMTGILTPKAPETISTTHCSHLPWYAYYKAGVDIDSNGGTIVTPRDILYSDELEVVQVFGMDIDDFR